MTFNSVYEITNNLSTIAGQHMIEYFSGNSLDDRWTTNNVQGTSTYAMADEVDGGFKITLAVGQWNRGTIYFNDIMQFAHDGSVCIGVVKAPDTHSEVYSGLVAGADMSNGTFNYCQYSQATNQANKRMITHNGSSMSETFTDVAVDTAWTEFKLMLDSASSSISLSGVLKATNTQYLPLAKMQGGFMVRARDDPVKSGQIRYMECYNT